MKDSTSPTPTAAASEAAPSNARPQRRGVPFPDGLAAGTLGSGVIVGAIGASWALVLLADLLTRGDLALSILYAIPIALTLWLPLGSMPGRPTLVVLSLALGATVLAMFVGADTRFGPAWRTGFAADPIALGNRLLGMGSQVVVAMTVARHRHAQAIERAVVARLEMALRTTDEFVALASHELKNPLAGARGYAQLLLRRATRGQTSGLDAQSTEALRLIDSLLGQLNALMDDLLHVSRVHSGQLDLALDRVDLAARARRVVEEAARRAPGHAITLVAPPEGACARADGRRIDQVLINLVGNAVKYSPEGGRIAVSISQQRQPLPAEPGDDDSATASAAANGWVVVRVRDDGMGIPRAEHARLFQRFVRASNADASPIAGTGLGLYLCRMLVEAQGGRIWLDQSEEGRGSTFAFALPAWPEGDRLDSGGSSRGGRDYLEGGSSPHGAVSHFEPREPLHAGMLWLGRAPAMRWAAPAARR